MTRNSTIHPVSIGNGLLVRVRQPESLLDAYKRLQAACEHMKRDSGGTCYHCGHRMPCERREAFGG